MPKKTTQSRREWHVDAGDHIEKVNRAATNGPKAKDGLQAGYTRLGDGFPPGSRCDPHHAGGKPFYGSSYQYNGSTGRRVYTPSKGPKEA